MTALLRRPMPRSHAEHHSLGKGYPVWVLAAQFALVSFNFIGFDTVRGVNPKPYFVLTMLVLASIVLLAPHGLMNRVQLSVPVVLFVSWWLLSYVWSPLPGEWINQSIAQLTPLLVLTVIVSVLPMDRFIATWLASIYAMIAYTFLYVLAYPSDATLSIDPFTGMLTSAGWSGAFNHKNNLAAYMVLGLLVVLSFEKRPVLRRGAAVAMIFLVLMSRSGTGGGALATALVSLYWCRRYARRDARKGGSQIVVSFLVSIVGVALIAISMPSIVAIYGKDLTFTGRTDIWRASLLAIREQPWTGYGWGGVWIDPTKEPTFGIIRSLGYIVFHAHNGAIELMLELGVVGLGLFLAVFATTLAGGWRLLRSHPAFGAVVVSYCLVVFVSSISEVLVLGPWLAVLVMLRAGTQRLQADERRAARERGSPPRRRRPIASTP